MEIKIDASTFEKLVAAIQEQVRANSAKTEFLMVREEEGLVEENRRKKIQNDRAEVDLERARWALDQDKVNAEEKKKKENFNSKLDEVFGENPNS